MTKKTKLFAYYNTEKLPEVAGKKLPESGVTYSEWRYNNEICQQVGLALVAEVEFDTPDVVVDRESIVEELRKQVAVAEAEHYKKVTAMKANIDRLLAIEHKG